MSRKTKNAERYINPRQVGGIDSYSIDDGAGRGMRALCVNTGAGLRYRVLPDRGLDIDHAFFNQHSLAFLTHQNAPVPSRALDRDAEWLKGFPGGLLTCCGPFSVGRPVTDQGEELGLHGTHSNTACEIESIIQPRHAQDQARLAIVGTIRYGKLFGPCVELRRTIESTLGSNRIDITDEFFNAGNQSVPHAWLLHINFGYPLLDEGGEFCYDSPKVEPVDSPASKARFTNGVNYKRVPKPMEEHRGSSEFVAYLYPKANRAGDTTVALVNSKHQLAVAIHYNTREFPRCAHWQHYGPGEYVAALEPANCGVEGRDKDRQRGWLDSIGADARKTYRYSIDVLTDRNSLAALKKL